MARGAWRMPGYRVEELLGAGSSGEVWRGRVNATGAAVALKRIWLSDPGQRKAAISEAAMLAALDHPHLMKLHELCHVEDDAIVLVIDLASAGSLASLLARRGRLTLGEVITAIAPIGAALAYAHHNGVVHGDVSPGNILFTDIGLPLLADLGFSRLFGDLTAVRTTPAYADPAVAAGALPGPASDVFMLAGVALHALTGSPPWPGTEPLQVLEVAASGAQPDFAARLATAGVPETTAQILARALRIEPTQRGTAADLALDLRHSAEPVAVELSAGRVRVAPTAGAVLGSAGGRVGSWPLDPLPPVSARPSSSAVPVVPFVGEQPLTFGVRAPAPFTTPPGRHLAQGRLRVGTGFTVCVAVLAIAVAASIWWWPFSGGDQHHRAGAVVRATAPSRFPARPPAPSAPRSKRPASGPPTATASHPAAIALDRTHARTVLADLDATRAAAFATRNPSLLTSVYESTLLLARDRALLMSIVPAGCGLRGVHTRFSAIVITARTANLVRLRLRSSLAPSTLVCGGTPCGRASGGPAISVRIDLVRHGASYRISTRRRG